MKDSVIPDQCRESVVILIIKNRNENVADLDNY